MNDAERLKIFKVYETQREKVYFLTCSPNENANQPAHPFSLTRVFVVRIKHFASLAIQNAPRAESDQTAQSHVTLRWTHMSKGMFSGFGDHSNLFLHSFGSIFQITFVVRFLNKLSIGKKFVCKLERLNVKQRRS